MQLHAWVALHLPVKPTRATPLQQQEHAQSQARARPDSLTVSLPIPMHLTTRIHQVCDASISTPVSRFSRNSSSAQGLESMQPQSREPMVCSTCGLQGAEGVAWR